MTADLLLRRAATVSGALMPLTLPQAKNQRLARIRIDPRAKNSLLKTHVTVAADLQELQHHDHRQDQRY
jgi:hypothetical protein